MSEFEKTDINRVRRAPARGQYDKETIYSFVDDALICHVSFVQDGRPFLIPTLHARRDDEIMLHGAASSRLIRHIQAGNDVSIAVTHVDGIVLARSAFHHSINYRSAVMFGKGYLIEGDDATMEALEQFTNRLLPERWAETRPPNEKELKATAVVAVPIDIASAKIRTGPPVDDEEDYDLPYWAGVIPMSVKYGPPVADDRLAEEIKLPNKVESFINKRNG